MFNSSFWLSLLWLSAAFGALCWIGLLLLPYRPWSTAEHLDEPGPLDQNLEDITVLIPARNEADTITETLEALQAQGKNLKVIVIDDQSTDGTREVIEQIASRSTTNFALKCLTGSALPEGWAGKMWALEQARKLANTRWILLLDADIQLKPGTIPALAQKIRQEHLDYASLMAHLKMETFWERLLIPAFIYFFKLLYPFSLANRTRWKKFSAGAGGCVLLERDRLETIGGFAAIHGAIIDDCALAAAIKKSGGRIWIGLSKLAVSRRDYSELSSIWNMVARSAYTQLLYSPVLLALTTIAMLSMFVAPLFAFGTLALHSPSPMQFIWVVLGVVAMLITYSPTNRYYRLPFGWILTIPLAGTFYLAMTWSSAIRYWKGARSEWKGRTYAR